MVKDDGRRIPDGLWEQMEPLLPPRLLTRLAVTGRACPTGMR
jgi:hypothetical protein